MANALMDSWKDLLASASFAKKPGYRQPVMASRRLENATTIVREFLAAGLPLGVALAAVVNANAESELYEKAKAVPPEDSLGLFQINSLSGKRIFTGDRFDPLFNTRWMIEEYRAHENDTSQKDTSTGYMAKAESMVRALARDATLAELAGLFSFHMERPKDLKGQQAHREEMARKLFPTVADLPSSELDALVGGGGPTEAASDYLSSAKSWVSSFFEGPTTGKFTADSSKYALKSADGSVIAQGEVPAGSYVVLYDKKPLTEGGKAFRLDIVPGSTYTFDNFRLKITS
jgi:hypothetical protein